MKVDSAKFIKSALRLDQCPCDGRPEIAFVGRSNVGKSTLMNALLGRKGLAKTSATPGKTQTINFFDINNKFYFVDLPGYGYAKVPKSMKAQWNRAMLDYLQARETLRLVVSLVDARHKPTDNDLHMLELLDQAEVPVLIVATKLDKLKQKDRKKNLNAIERAFELEEEGCVLPVSAVKGTNLKELWQIIEEIL